MTRHRKNRKVSAASPSRSIESHSWSGAFFSAVSQVSSIVARSAKQVAETTGLSKIFSASVVLFPRLVAAESFVLKSSDTGQVFQGDYSQEITVDPKYPKIADFMNAIPQCNVTLTTGLDVMQNALETLNNAWVEFAKYDCIKGGGGGGPVKETYGENIIKLLQDQPFNEIAKCLKDILDGFQEICERENAKGELDNKQIGIILGSVFGGLLLLAGAGAFIHYLHKKRADRSEIKNDSYLNLEAGRQIQLNKK